jgi:hypothetical protein
MIQIPRSPYSADFVGRGLRAFSPIHPLATAAQVGFGGDHGSVGRTRSSTPSRTIPARLDPLGYWPPEPKWNRGGSANSQALLRGSSK